MTPPSDARRLTPRLLWIGFGAVLLAIAVGAVAALWVLPVAAPQALVAPVPAPASSPVPQAPAAPPVTEASLAKILTGRQAITMFYRLNENPRILVIDFPDLTEQALMMNRIAALVEKSGAPRDHLLSDAELADFISSGGGDMATFYLAHDYSAPSLAHFYSLAETEGEALNDREKSLLALLVGAGVIGRASAGYAALDPELAVISVVQPQGDIDAALREAMLRHEVSHGEFFTNPAYRLHCERFWHERLTEAERATFRNFLERADYDQSDETLMINETQAYLMHTPDPRVFSASRLGTSDASLIDLQRRFMTPQPPTPLLGGMRPGDG